jgi:hypothetical protein
VGETAKDARDLGKRFAVGGGKNESGIGFVDGELDEATESCLTIIFNWECSIRRLKVHDPATGQWWDAGDQGFITVDQWHEIVWEIKPSSTRVLVDGHLRFERNGEWGNIEAPLAIGPCFGSAVTVRSFAVEQA